MTSTDRQTWIQLGEADRADDDHAARKGRTLAPADDMAACLADHHEADLADLSDDDREEAIAAMVEGCGR